MKYRQLGKYGVRLSAIGIGSWLTYGMGIDDKMAQKCIQTALEQGVIFFDTADIYNKGEAELSLGRIFFDELNIRREDVVIASKCFWPMSANPNDQGLSRKHIVESVNKSLKRLQTDYIDLYQCHRYDPYTPMEEICRAYNDLIQQGKLIYWGVSEWPAENIDEAISVCEKLSLHKPVSNQPQYNIIRSQIETNGVMESCEKAGMGEVVWSPLAQGLLSGKYSGGVIPKDSRAAHDKMGSFMRDSVADKTLLAKVDKFKAYAENLGVSASQLALAWCLRKTNITSAITSASRPEQVIENCAAADIEFTPEFDKKILEIFA
ncbi:MAG: aldo/keto reductase family protein [Ignavibacteria bacterium]|nr:aldo/keto reductase family protein [Ignavibacteria bacterium]